MNIRKRRSTRSTGVTLELVVLEYLQELAEKDDRDRSYCINEIVREHAERNGYPGGGAVCHPVAGAAGRTSVGAGLEPAVRQSQPAEAPGRPQGKDESVAVSGAARR